MTINTAKACFGENFQFFSDPKATPEKFNLYRGLYILAETLEQMQAELATLRYEVALLRQGR